MSELSITQWIDGLKSGDELAAEQVWNRYFQKLVNLARRKLTASHRKVSDEEDVALSAIDSFCRGAAAGRFPRLEDRDDLWSLLFTITERKALRQVQFEKRAKRGGGKVSGQSVFTRDDPTNERPFDDAVAASEPTPEMALEIAENIQLLLKKLDDSTLHQIAIAKMEGYTNEEIAEQLNSSIRSIKRRLKLIRVLWSQE